MLGGCGVVVYSCTGGLYLYRIGHGFGFCSGCHIPV
nr:MAG TPA: cytochrome c-553 [Caudoviricetes sp.]